MKLFLCDDSKLEDVAPLAAANGCGIEVQAFYDPEILTRQPGAIREHAEALRGIVPRALHGPFGDLCPGSFDSMVRGVARNRCDLAARLATELSVTHLILHHGYVPGTSSPPNWILRSREFWRSYLDSIPDSLTVHIENMLDDAPDIILDVVDAVDRDNFDVCLDVGHVHCRSKAKIIEWIERLGPRVGYVHLHDNHGEEDEHLGLGLGTLAMPEVCHALREEAPTAVWALETRVPEMPASIDWLSSHGFSFS